MHVALAWIVVALACLQESATALPSPKRTRSLINTVPRGFEGRWANGVYRQLPPVNPKKKRKAGAAISPTRPGNLHARQATPSSLPLAPSMNGIIRVVDSLGNVASLSPSLDGANRFTTISSRSAALPVSLPSTCPAGIFPLFSALTGGCVGASVSSSEPLSNSISNLFKRQLPAAIATAAAVQAAADLAYKNIIAAELSAAILIFQAAEAAQGPISSAPSLAAAATAAQANYAQAYTACVAYNAAKTKAANVLAAGADPSLAPRFAAEEIAVAAAAAPLGGDPFCGTLTALYQTSTTAASLSAAYTLISTSPFIAITSTIAPVVATSPVVASVVEPVVSPTSAVSSLAIPGYSAAIIPSSPDNTDKSAGTIWQLSCDANAGAAQTLQAVYRNANGNIVSPITFFVIGDLAANSIRLTGDLVAYNLRNPTAIGTQVFLAYLST